MSDVGLVLDPVFEEHDTGPGHPERPERLAALRGHPGMVSLVQRCVRVEPVEVDDDDLQRVHERSYVSRVAESCASGPGVVDSMDTAVCPASARIARLAAGSVLDLGRRIATGELRRGFAAVRPPGHHAERERAMGFCLFGNVAVAARALQRRYGVGRVLIVDWDVHHGNGTQHAFEDDPTVLYFSCHQSPLYPGTGAASERGRGDGLGTTVNCPLPPGAGDDEFLGALRGSLVEAADRFAPSFVIVSAGFDAHRRDPLAQLEVSTEAYQEATRIVRGIADRHADGRLLSVLEGGYDLGALSESVTTHLAGLLERSGRAIRPASGKPLEG
jgi:acetoin utilization deacetylase AcuC-like enzyme